MKEFLFLLHPVFGALGILSTVWLFIETLNARAANVARIWYAAISSALFMIATWIAGGYWYVTYYATDKAIILAGPFPLAHTFFMEAKEHGFFITLILAILLPIVVRDNDLASNAAARRLTLAVAALVFLSAFAIEGAGSVIAMGVRVGLMSAGAH